MSSLNWFIGTWLFIYFFGFVILVVLFPNIDVGGVKYETFTSGWLELLAVVFVGGMMVRKDLRRF